MTSVPPPRYRCLPGLVLALGLVLPGSPARPARDWNQAYQRLHTRIRKNFEQPPTKSPLEVYLQWMEHKARDRDEVQDLLQEVQQRLRQDPDNAELKVWVERFSALLKWAQASGEGTVNEAAMFYMYIRDPKCPQCGDWQEVIGRLQQDGRRIYQKAQETGFLTPQVKGRARCMINFSIRSVESDPGGWGVYRGRESVHGTPDAQGNVTLPEGDFDVDCAPRTAFTTTDRGEPDKPTEMGLTWIEQVREEARWWKFGDAVNDATDLMEEFYRDSMCETPPNGCDKGHTHYRDLATQYRLNRGLKYNRGFYGTVYGNVEVARPSGRKPVRNATVVIKSQIDGRTWQGQTDDQGRYEIHNVLLHRECKPLRITVTAGNDRKSETFPGPLEQPDPGYRYEKNFVFRKRPGTLTMNIDVQWDYANDDVRFMGYFQARVQGRMKLIDAQGTFQRYRAENVVFAYDFNSEDFILGEPCYGKVHHRTFGKGNARLIGAIIDIFFWKKEFQLTLIVQGQQEVYNPVSRTQCVLQHTMTTPTGFLVQITGPITPHRLVGNYHWTGDSEEATYINGNTMVHLGIETVFLPGSSVKNVDYRVSFQFPYGTSRR